MPCDRIIDHSETHILEEIAADRARRRSRPERHVHLVLENDDNDAHLLERDATAGRSTTTRSGTTTSTTSTITC